MPQAKKKHASTHAWSEWKWSEQYQRFYCERLNRHGQVEYEWGQESSQIPRNDETPVDLAASFNDLNLDPSSYSQSQAGLYQGPETSQHDAPIHVHSATSQYTHDRQQYDEHAYSTTSRDKGKGKGKSRATDDPYTSYPETTHVFNKNTQQRYPEHSAYGGHSGTNIGGTLPTYSGTDQTYADNPSLYYPGSGDYAGDDSALQQALNESRNETYGHGSVGDSSYSTAGYSGVQFDPATYASNAQVLETDLTPRGTPIPASHTSRASSDFIAGTPGAIEQFDPRFVVESSHKFQPGEVFKILWSEPLGQVGGEEISDVQSVKTAGNHFYIGYRRFIIVSTDESHHSTCVPILTYDRRGCNKRGIKPNKHGIVYAAGSRPRLLKNEPPLGFDPVALEIDAEGESLAKESRVNYSKLVTIEHNVKVFFIGRISLQDFEIVTNAVNNCWEAKMHKSKKRR
ncbi:hypothetical protein F5Y16DRAFT_103805 [Xylariaceae sp. FL0255]|nr:hypothetical protein F5Y16DRAFT_103805 [Xylariaceae sp. FL0255]